MNTKGTLSNPYSLEEYEAMLDAGTWKGGYVKGLGYCLPEVQIVASSNSMDISDSEHSDLDTSWWPDSSDPFSDPGNNNSSDGANQGGTDGDGNNTGTSGNSNTGNGSNNAGGSSMGNGNNSNIDNAGEADHTPLYTFTQEEANALMDSGKWKGGYVDGITSYVGPNTTCGPSRIALPVSGEEILQNALEFIGTPYQSGGCNQSGIDCSGLVTVALKIPRWTTHDGDIPGMNKIALPNIKEENLLAELQKGDILVWRKGNGFRSGHAAIYVEGTKIFHAHGDKGTPTGYTQDLMRYWVERRGIPDVYRK